MPAEQPTPEEASDARISRAEAELALLLGWVRAAESRLALVLPLATAMLGALAVLAPPASRWTVVGGIPEPEDMGDRPGCNS